MNVYKKIDWFYWANRKSVSIMDAALLGCNINPKGRPQYTLSTLSDEVGNLCDLINDNRDDCDYFSINYKNGYPTIILSELASWCQSIGYPIPDELKALAKPKALEPPNRNINENLNDNAPTDKKPMSENVRNTLLKMILGMAIDGYSYQVNDERSPLTGTTSEGLSAMLKMHDIDISHRTIKKYLTEAKEKCMHKK